MIELKSGDLVEHYRIVEKIEHKGMGEVFIADDLVLSRLVVLKFHTEKGTSSDPSLLKRFSNEASIVASLNDKRIINIFSFGTYEGYSFMVMEYFESESVKEYIQKNGPMDLPRAIHIVSEILKGLVSVHQKGILHRDIKSSNILIDEENNVKIIDFGISKRLIDENEKLTKTDHLVGTLQYMAPEVLSGHKPSPASDLYSVGILLYEMLTGKNPYDGLNKFATMERIKNRPLSLPQIPKTEIPPKLFSIFTKMVHQDSKRRYRDLTEVIKELKTLNSVKIPDFQNLLENTNPDSFKTKKSSRKKSFSELWDQIDSIGPITIPKVEEMKTKHRPNLLFVVTAILFILLNRPFVDFTSLSLQDFKLFVSKMGFSEKAKTAGGSQNGDRSPASVAADSFNPSPILEKGNVIDYDVYQKSGRSGKTLQSFQSRSKIKSRRDKEYLVSIKAGPVSKTEVVPENPFFPIRKLDPKHGYNIQLPKPETFDDFFPLHVGKKGSYSYFKLDKNGSFEEHKTTCQVYSESEMAFLGRNIPVFKVACETQAPGYKEKAMYYYSPHYKYNIRDDIAVENGKTSIIEVRQVRALSNAK